MEIGFVRNDFINDKMATSKKKTCTHAVMDAFVYFCALRYISIFKINIKYVVPLNLQFADITKAKPGDAISVEF